jgi:hypothetical protein
MSAALNAMVVDGQSELRWLRTARGTSKESVVFMSKKQIRVLWPVVAAGVTALVVTIIVLGRARTSVASLSGSKDLATAPSRSGGTLIGASAGKQRIETELITITSRGFEPAEIARPKGRIQIAVANRSGLPQVTLWLDREAGERLREVGVPREQPDWDDLFDLTPGRYILSEANHSLWTCHITITAQ